MAQKFSLQSVLDFRHSQVEALEIEFGKILAARQEMEVRLENLRTTHEQVCLQLYRSQTGEMDIFFVQQLQASLNQVREAATVVCREIEELEKIKDAKRQELITAKQSEETLGILKTKETERFRMGQTAQESRLQDDLYISRGFHQRHEAF
jgi:flagellar export protein FliJ